MGRKSFTGPRTASVKKDMKVSGVKNSGGGGVKQGGKTSPHAKKSNP